MKRCIKNIPDRQMTFELCSYGVDCLLQIWGPKLFLSISPFYSEIKYFSNRYDEVKKMDNRQLTLSRKAPSQTNNKNFKWTQDTFISYHVIIIQCSQEGRALFHDNL